MTLTDVSTTPDAAASLPASQGICQYVLPRAYML